MLITFLVLVVTFTAFCFYKAANLILERGQEGSQLVPIAEDQLTGIGNKLSEYFGASTEIVMYGAGAAAGFIVAIILILILIFK